MRIVLALVSCLSLGLTPLSIAGGRYGSSDLTVSFDDEGKGPIDCSALTVRIDGKKATVQEEQIDIPAGDVLNVRAREHGGVHVQPGSGAGYTARLCKAAIDPATTSAIRAQLQERTLTVEGPSDGDRWVGYLIIDAPADASMKVESTNAPITLKRVQGSFVAKAKNGPISIEDAAGTIDAATQNGPIALTGSEGDVKLRAQNGPVAVELDREWRGKGLDARTENGPVALTVSSSFRSGIEVQSQGGSPWNCDGPACEGWRMDGSRGGRVFRMGEGPAVVRLSTRNGPVAIQSPEL